MLINAVLAVLILFLRALLLPLKIASFPVQVSATVLTIIAKLEEGAAIVNAYVDETYLGILFGFLLLVIGLVNGYRFIRWILKKIPFLGID